MSNDKIVSSTGTWLCDYLSNSPCNGIFIYFFDDELIESKLLRIICKQYNIKHKLFYATFDNLSNLVDKAKSEKHLIISSINKNKYEFIRDYPKYFNPDLAPFADTFRSEILISLSTFMPINSLAIMDSLHKTGFSWRIIEWAYRQNYLNGIIESDKDPTSSNLWVSYNMDQKRVIAKISQLEKTTRHKINPNLPILFHV